MKRKATFLLYILLILLLIVLVGCTPSKGKATYTVRRDDITYCVQATGKVQSNKQEYITYNVPLKLDKIVKMKGEIVKKNDLAATVDQQFVMTQIINIQKKIDADSAIFNSHSCILTANKIKSPVNGRIKIVTSSGNQTGTGVDNTNTVIMISTKAEMYFTVGVGGFTTGQNLLVRIGDKQIYGIVVDTTDNSARITVESDEFPLGAEASVQDSSGVTLKGALKLSEFVPISCQHGIINKLLVSENQRVKAFTSLFSIKKYPEEVYSALDDIKDLQKQIDLYYQLYNEPEILCPYDGVLTDIPAEGEVYDAGVKLFAVSLSEDTKVSLSVDEYDINKINKGQNVKLTIDSNLQKTLNGTVVFVSDYSSDKDASLAKFVVAVKPDTQDSLMLGSDVFGSIIVDKATDVLVVPISAIYTDKSGAQYVLLDMKKDDKRYDSLGNEYPKNAVIIKTGIQDGRFAEVIAGLSEGDVVLLN